MGSSRSSLDITDNPKKLKFVEIDAAQSPRALDDVDAAAINTNYATQAGLDPVKDPILREDPKGPYVNLIAVRAADKDKPWVKTLVESYHTPEVKGIRPGQVQGCGVAELVSHGPGTARGTALKCCTPCVAKQTGQGDR